MNHKNRPRKNARPSSDANTAFPPQSIARRQWIAGVETDERSKLEHSSDATKFFRGLRRSSRDDAERQESDTSHR